MHRIKDNWIEIKSKWYIVDYLWLLELWSLFFFFSVLFSPYFFYNEFVLYVFLQLRFEFLGIVWFFYTYIKILKLDLYVSILCMVLLQ